MIIRILQVVNAMAFLSCSIFHFGAGNVYIYLHIKMDGWVVLEVSLQCMYGCLPLKKV